MAANDKQKIDVVANSAASLVAVRAKLAEGWVILSITNLAPVSNNLLILYATPETI